MIVSCGRYDFRVVSDAPGATTYRAAVLADQPVAYWRLDDTDMIARDQLGTNAGTYSGGCTLSVPGAITSDSDTAVGFDGTTCEVDLWIS